MEREGSGGGKIRIAKGRAGEIGRERERERGERGETGGDKDSEGEREKSSARELGRDGE